MGEEPGAEPGCSNPTAPAAAVRITKEVFREPDPLFPLSRSLSLPLFQARWGLRHQQQSGLESAETETHVLTLAFNLRPKVKVPGKSGAAQVGLISARYDENRTELDPQQDPGERRREEVQLTGSTGLTGLAVLTGLPGPAGLTDLTGPASVLFDC